MRGQRVQGRQGLEGVRVLCYVCLCLTPCNDKGGSSGVERSNCDGVEGHRGVVLKSCQAMRIDVRCRNTPVGVRELMSDSTI